MTSRILHLPKWSRSAQGRDIEIFFSDPAQDPKILFIGGVHGDEPEGRVLALELNKALHKYNTFQNSWALIPDLNPDGSAAHQRVNGRGVDLNRNFPTPNWSSECKAPRYFPGLQARSEPEVHAICNLLEQKSVKLIVHFHSWHPCVVFTGAPAQKFAQLLSPGPIYPVQEDIGYPTPGSLGEYGWSVLGIPVICIEEQEGTALDEVGPRFVPRLLQLVDSRSL